MITMPLFHCQTLEGYDCGGASNFTFRGFHQKRKVDMGLENQLEDFELEQRVNFPKRPCLWPTQGTPQNLSPDSRQQQMPGLCLPLESQHEICERKDLTRQQSPNLHAQSHVLSLDPFHNAFHHTESNNLPCGASNEHSEYMTWDKAGNQQETWVAVTSSNSLPRNMGSNNLAQHFLSRMQWRKQEAEERQKTGSDNNNIYYKPESPVEQMDQEDQEMVSELEHQNYADSTQYNRDMKQEAQRETPGQAMEPTSTEMDSDSGTAQYITGYIPISSPQNIEYGDTPRHCPSLSCSGLKPSPVSGRLHCHCSASWRGMYGIDSGYGTDYY